jgi:hypothetical protein
MAPVLPAPAAAALSPLRRVSLPASGGPRAFPSSSVKQLPKFAARSSSGGGGARPDPKAGIQPLVFAAGSRRLSRYREHIVLTLSSVAVLLAVRVLVGDNESKAVLDAFFLGKALAEALTERAESVVGEVFSVVGQWQAEQQKQVQEFQVLRNAILYPVGI